MLVKCNIAAILGRKREYTENTIFKETKKGRRRAACPDLSMKQVLVGLVLGVVTLAHAFPADSNEDQDYLQMVARLAAAKVKCLSFFLMLKIV